MPEHWSRSYGPDVCSWSRSSGNAGRTDGFSGIEDLIDNQGEVAFTLEYNHDTRQACFVAYCPLSDLDDESLLHPYLSACDDPELAATYESLLLHLSDRDQSPLSPVPNDSALSSSSSSSSTDALPNDGPMTLCIICGPVVIMCTDDTYLRK